jgi:carbamoyltransferase
LSVPDQPGGHNLQLRVASYHEASLQEDVLHREVFSGGLNIGRTSFSYTSYLHTAGHILGAYCTSPFAASNEPSYVLIWDGGQYPRLYYVDPERRTVANKGPLFSFLGSIYAIMGNYFGPYRLTEEQLAKDAHRRLVEGHTGGYLATSGKLMAYIALGSIQHDLLKMLPEIHRREQHEANGFEHRYALAVSDYVKGRGYSDADVLLTQHVYLERLLIAGLSRKIEQGGMAAKNFVFAGGSALNIKWNSAARDSGLFHSTWVPPFPNDAGSGIGTACCEMFNEGTTSLQWNVYSGPSVYRGTIQPGWRAQPASVSELAQILADRHEPIVFLEGRAELGPRALGNRSILAPATHERMKEHLNHIKNREEFRPVAPICMECYASEVFDPGTPDPYMLFDHRVKEHWVERVPAICHVDGTARLQTLNEQQNPLVYRLIAEYEKLTGVPLLCNTSANLNGSGFFPDVESAMRWGGCNYIYSNGVLYEKEDPTPPELD